MWLLSFLLKCLAYFSVFLSSFEEHETFLFAEITMDNSDKEGHFKNTITLALNKNIPWEKLPLILHEMTPTLEETKQLVQVLLDLLQTMQITLEQEPIVAQIPTNEPLEDESELPNDVDDGVGSGSVGAGGHTSVPFVVRDRHQSLGKGWQEGQAPSAARASKSVHGTNHWLHV